MWELICHHTYDWHGLPIDHSVYHTDGKGSEVSTLADGVAPGSGAIHFPNRQGRVRVPLSAAWQPLDGLKIECTARILSPLHDDIPRTLIAGDGAFSFYVRLGALSLTVGQSTVVDTSDPGGYRVPNNIWVNLGAICDGSRVSLSADGHEVIAQEVSTGVPGVGAGGVSIGNKPGANESIRGDIDEIRVWRLDPRAMWHDFAKRPINRRTANCWNDFLQRLEETLRAHPECATRLLSELTEVLERHVRLLGSHGPAARTRAGDFAARYRLLWQNGKIDGAAAAKLIAEWNAWMKSLGIDLTTDPQLRALLNSDCFWLLIGASAGLDCDKKFRRYLGHFASARGTTG